MLRCTSIYTLFFLDFVQVTHCLCLSRMHADLQPQTWFEKMSDCDLFWLARAITYQNWSV